MLPETSVVLSAACATLPAISRVAEVCCSIVEAMVLEDQVVDLLLEQASVKPVEKSLKEVMQGTEQGKSDAESED